MMVFLTMLGVIAAAVAGILLYRWGWLDGRDSAKPTAKPRAAKPKPEPEMQEWMAKQLAELANFMQYDGSERERGDN